jgi:uncharacterized protein with HEPN domain
MLEAATKAMALLGDRKLADLSDDDTLALALARLLEILGEAASRVSKDFRNQHPEVPWTKIAGTRNRLIHAYFFTDLGVVHEIITVDLPPLIERLRTLSPRDAS